MPEWLPLVIVALIAASGGWLTYLTNKRSADAQRITALEQRLSRMERRDAAWQNYAQLLRQHINDEKGPPAPDIPLAIFEVNS